MIIELEPEEAQYVCDILKKQPYEKVFIIINKMARVFKEHNDEIDAKESAEAEEMIQDQEKSKKDGKK